MAVITTLAACSQTPALNGPDGAVDAPSTLDDGIRYALSFIATLRDGKAGVAELDVASGSTTDIGGTNSPLVRITGTTTITSFGTSYNGPRFVRFAGALTLTHSSSLILPNAANITTAAGDFAIVVPVGSTPSGWQVVSYQCAAAQAWVDVTSSRTAGITYTNTTPRAITVSASVLGAVNGGVVGVSWICGVTGIGGNSQVAGTPASNTELSAQAVVPPGATYVLNVTNGTVNRWRELR